MKTAAPVTPNRTVHTLGEGLALSSPSHVALVGGGGKTSLMFRLAAETAGAGKRVVTGTTTKIALPGEEETPLLLTREGRSDFPSIVARELDRWRHVTVGESIMLAEGKVRGCAADEFDRLFRSRAADVIVEECDGARRKPLKAPREGEPVVPSSATHVIGIMGMDALDAPLDDDHVFQPELLAEIAGQRPGDRVSPLTLYRLAVHERGLFKGAPPNARRIVFLNKCDRAEESGLTQVLETLGRLPFAARIVWGSLRPEIAVRWEETSTTLSGE